jgi:TRAP-type C4-dicarboxylate transport system permease small subunit
MVNIKIPPSLFSKRLGGPIRVRRCIIKSSSTMSLLVKWIKKCNSGLAALQRGFLFFTMGLLTIAMFTEIVSRYVFHNSFFGLEHFIGFASMWVYFIGSAYGSYERSHVKAELIRTIVRSKRTYNIIRAVSAAISTTVSCIFVIWSYEFCMESIAMKETTWTYHVPMVYFQSSLFVGGILMVAYFLWETIDCAHDAYRS